MNELPRSTATHGRLTIFAIVAAGLALSVVLSGPALAAKNPDAIWIEGEESTAHHLSFVPAVDAEGQVKMCSGNMTLRLFVAQNDVDATKLPFYAEYEFQVSKEGDYKLWIASTPMADAWASPLGYRLDGGKLVSLEGDKPAGAFYGKKYAWHALGVRSLRKGKHTLRIEVLRKRKMDNMWAAFIDAILITPDLAYVPAGYTEYSPLVPSQAITELEFYKFRSARATAEEVGAKAASEVRAKLSRRPINRPWRPVDGIGRFGLHGAERPFINWNGDLKRQAEVFELVSRVGVQSFRTSEGCWHRLGKKFSDFHDFDYQISNAIRHGQTFNLTVGYPDNEFTVGPGLSTFKPQYESLYRRYVRAVLERAKARGAKVELFEIGNEIDAGFLWYQGGTAESYITECRIWKEEAAKILPGAKICAFGGLTWSRDPKAKPPEWGRPFVDKCFQLGINKYADAYAMHYTWPSSEKGFNEYLERKMKEAGGNRLKVNTEESAYGHPSDILKLFARDFFLWDYRRVDYYLTQDWFEGDQLISCGLFDREWNPKLRLLSYALSVDAMDGRELAGMAAPAANVEAYVLRFPAGAADKKPKYSIVIWENDAKNAPELLSPPTCSRRGFKGCTVSGFKAVAAASNWRLDPIAFDAKAAAFKVTPNPIVVFADALPDWKLMSAAEWKAKMNETKRADAAIVPNR
jgi:hypothetical protein